MATVQRSARRRGRPAALAAAAIAGLVLVGGLVAAAWAGGWLGADRRGPEPLRLPGVVEVQEIRLGSKVGGRVREVRVAEGQLVGPGEVLVTFEVPELEAQRAQWDARRRADEAELEEARNGPRPEEIAAAEAAVDAARARWERVKAGYREEEIREALDQWQTAKADRTYADRQLDRYEQLVAKGSATEAELDSTRANAEAARGRASAAKDRVDLLSAGNRPEDIAEAAAMLGQAAADLALLKAGTRAEEIARLEAELAETRARLVEIDANLDEAAVEAPSRAVVDVVGVRKGDLVAPGQPVVRALRADDLWVKVFVPEPVLGRLRIGQPAAVTIDAYPGRRFDGTLSFIAGASEFTPRNVQSADERSHQVFAAKVRVDEPGGVFKSGMAAVATLVPRGPGG